MAKMTDGCVQPAKGPISQRVEESDVQANVGKEKIGMIARVGKPAPDFELSAYVPEGFKNIKLSDYKGRWTVICFYPGDFTFV